MSRAGSSATSRLRQDYIRLKRDPVPYITAEPLPSNILEWRYIVKGPENTPYYGGIYFGKLVFPSEFPYKPPSIYMLTPNGRFKTNTRLCLSISDYHPDTWNPAWSVATILTGLLSFMVDRSPTTGSIDTTDNDKHRLAMQSSEYNLKDRTFCDLFPDIVKEIKQQQAAQLEQEKLNQSNSRDSVHGNSTGMGNGRPATGALGSAMANIVIIVGFAAFAYTVKCVISSIAQ